MNNLTTRKIVLGLLMALVLAFGVQGIADALTFGTSRSGDLQTVDEEDKFTIRFSVNLKSPQAVNSGTRRASSTDIGYADGTRTRTAPNDQRSHTLTEDTGYADGDTHYYTVTTTATEQNDDNVDITVTTHTRNWLTEGDAYYYNNEAVSISSGDITLKKGNTAVTSLMERHSERDQQLSSSVTLTGSHDAPGAFDIVITDNTATADFPSNAQPPSDRASITFTIYVVGDAATTSASAVHLAATSGGTTPLEYQVRGNQDSRIFVVVTDGTNLPVTITVNGGGRVYVEAASDRRTSATTSLSTSSAAPIQLSMNSRTNKVTASIVGLGSHTATYIYGNPSLEKISGTGQMGIADGRLDTALGVRLTDFGDRAVSGIPVTFSENGGTFIPVPGQTLYKDSDDDLRTATPTKPGESENSIIVYTDSRGEAYVYYQFESNDAGLVPVVATVSATRPTTATFEPEVDDATRRPTLSILSGNNQRTDEDGELEDPLVVVVRRDGNLKPGEEVTFRTSKGTLIGRNSDNSDDSTSKRVYGTTDASGEAEVTYYQEAGSGNDTVTATINGTNPDYEKTVTFGINGASGTAPRQPSQPSQPAAATNRITISPLNTTGEPGEEVTVNVASSPSGVFATLGSNDFEATRFSPQSGVTPFTSTLLLPVEEGTHSFFATGGTFTAGTASVTVETELGTLSITAIGTPAAGAQTFSISAVDSDGDRASAPFTARLSGTGFTSRNVEIAGGRGNARVTLPTAARLYTLTVSATGYD